MKSAALAVAILCCAISVSGQQCLTFAPGPSPTLLAGTAPNSSAIGDFNADGRPDLAVANQSDSISVFLGTGGGVFGPASTFTAGPWPWDILTTDLNEDGRLDLAVTLRNALAVAVFLGNGDGTFSAPTIFPTAGGPTSIAAGDFNEDGNVDLAVGAFSSVAIHLGTGTGSFGGPLNFPAPIAWDIVADDFSEDGHLDLAMTHPFSNQVAVMFGIGNGGFGPATFFAAPTDPRSIVAGDFNGDGRVDFAFTNTGSGTVTVMLRNGPASFAPQAHYLSHDPSDPDLDPPQPNSLDLADFNGDGVIDLVVTNFARPGFFVLTGTGTGAFNAAVGFGVATAPTDVTAGDVDGNGSPDIVRTSIFPDVVSVYVNGCADAHDPAVPALSPMALLLLAAGVAVAGVFAMRR